MSALQLDYGCFSRQIVGFKYTTIFQSLFVAKVLELQQPQAPESICYLSLVINYQGHWLIRKNIIFCKSWKTYRNCSALRTLATDFTFFSLKNWNLFFHKTVDWANTFFCLLFFDTIDIWGAMSQSLKSTKTNILTKKPNLKEYILDFSHLLYNSQP